MNRAILFGIPMFLAIVGILFFMAGQARFDIMPSNYARFAGMACMLLSGLGWVVFGVTRRSESG